MRRRLLTDKAALIATLLARIEALMGANARLTARVAELEAKLGAPPKTPDNSSVPPSKGQKPSESSTPKDKARLHAGAHRPLDPNPTAKRAVFACRRRGCGADVSGVAQNPCEAYDRVKIPQVVRGGAEEYRRPVLDLVFFNSL
jgi:transposase